MPAKFLHGRKGSKSKVETDSSKAEDSISNKKTKIQDIGQIVEGWAKEDIKKQ